MKPYARDWKFHSPDVEYSEDLGLFYHNFRVYCELSAHHNGIIGEGAKLKELIKDDQNGNNSNCNS